MTHAVLFLTPRRNDRRGFGVAPILYMLGLIGVVGGTLFSSNMQVLKSNIAVQDSLTIRSDLQAASTTLSAEAVLGSDNLTLCPPRSIHQTSGEPCVLAPVALLQFGDFTGTAHLPAGYANAALSGSSVEVGVFVAGAGLKQLDPYGHTYIYCRWENPRSSPASPAFVLLSAGPDGILQTKCGDTVAQGDDSLTMLTVGEAINRAALWQSDSASNVSYGATGSKVVIDGSGDLTAAGTITGTAGNFTTLNVSGTSEFGGTSTFSGLLTAGTSGLGATSVSSLSDMGNAVISGNLGIGTTNPSQALTVEGNIFIQSSGLFLGTLNNRPVYSNSGDYEAGLGFTNVTGNGTGSVQLYTGNTARLTATANGNIGIGTATPDTQLEIYGTLPSVNLASTQNSQKEYQFVNDGNYAYIKDVTDALGEFRIRSNANADVARFSYAAPSGSFFLSPSGNVGINTTSPTSTLTVNGSASLGATTVSSLTDTGIASISGNLTGTTATFSGLVTAGSFSLSSLATFGGGATISGGPLTAGTSSLGTTTVNGLTDNGNDVIDGNLTVQGNTSLNSALNVNGTAILNNLVGIGTNNPQAPLDIYETSGSYAYIRDSQSGLKISACCGATAIESAGAGMTGAAPLAITDMNGAHTWLSFDASGNAKFWDKVGIGTATTGGTNGILGLSYNGNTDNMLVFTDTYSGGRYASTGRTWGLGDDTGNTCSAGQFCIYDFTAGALRFSIDPYGDVGIGTNNPQRIFQVHAATNQNIAITGNTTLSAGTLLYSMTDNNTAYQPLEIAASQFDFTQGNVGIGTASPAAMLDINGYMHMTKYTTAPATCSAALDGDIALSANYTLCICKNGTGWVTASTGSASCAW